jgi:rhodanese-related sulfurtransferase
MTSSKIKKIAFLLFVIAFIAAPAFSVRSDGTKDISADGLRTMLADKKPLLVVDTRTPYEYEEGHIPKAINIPRGKFYNMEKLLPKEKDCPIVFYCNGYGCLPSVKAAETAKNLGYTETMIFRAGFPVWAQKGYDIEKIR